MKKEFVEITILGKQGSRQIRLPVGQSLLTALRQAEPFFPASCIAPCGGRGRCGKCSVRLLSGSLPVTDRDRGQLGEKALSEGWRLACCAYPTEDITVYAQQEEGPMDILSLDSISMNSISKDILSKDILSMDTGAVSGEALFCVDIGTTTLAMTATDREGEVLQSYTAPNRQRGLGADVLSRIEGVAEGKGRLLQQLLREDLIEGIETLWKKCQRPSRCRVILAGNTTMIYLLMGYDTQELGSYPFAASHTDTIETTLGELLPEIHRRLAGVRAEILPGFSAFLGGDILADILALEDIREPWLMVDLGTNAEMVQGDGQTLTGTSAAAGPALEGGNIRYGVAGIQGAISRVRIAGRKAVIGTIGNSYPPVGICGTGVLEAVAAMLDTGILDRTGALSPLFAKEGYPLAVGRGGERILLDQQDIRSIQLAKAAIRSGIHSLLQAAGRQPEEIGRVYLFGGLGNALSPEIAIRLGLLPENFRGKVVHGGNGVLKGCQLWGSLPDIPAKADRLRDNMRVIHLAERDGFGEDFVRYVEFI